jgi:hypothetical protein
MRIKHFKTQCLYRMSISSDPYKVAVMGALSHVKPSFAGNFRIFFLPSTSTYRISLMSLGIAVNTGVFCSLASVVEEKTIKHSLFYHFLYC